MSGTSRIVLWTNLHAIECIKYLTWAFLGWFPLTKPDSLAKLSPDPSRKRTCQNGINSSFLGAFCWTLPCVLKRLLLCQLSPRFLSNSKCVNKVHYGDKNHYHNDCHTASDTNEKQCFTMNIDGIPTWEVNSVIFLIARQPTTRMIGWSTILTSKCSKTARWVSLDVMTRTSPQINGFPKFPWSFCRLYVDFLPYSWGYPKSKTLVKMNYYWL